MKIALAQLNSTIGDIEGNRRRILDAYSKAAAMGADLVVTPELSLVGYPPRDLLLKPRFVADNLAAFERLVGEVGRTGLLVGFVDHPVGTHGLPLHNAAALVAEGRVLAKKHKALLPMYDVFDELRYFEPGRGAHVVEFAGMKLGLSICEDIWTQETAAGPASCSYHGNPIAELVQAGADLLVNMSASPFEIRKFAQRGDLVRTQVLKYRRPVVCVNQVGGNDELVFDGASFAMDASGALVAQLPAFEEDLAMAEIPGGAPLSTVPAPMPDVVAVRGALVLGLRDYVRKCGFKDVVLGLSGGVDSSVVACLAAEALGADHVVGVAMPSRYSSPPSLEDAEALARNLGVRFLVIPIEQPHRAMETALAETFKSAKPDVTEENVQARIRGNILMALSNKFGWLVLSTGNKSELACGYCTLYGDMAGGLAVISDVPKTLIYELARQINTDADRSPIPDRVLEKPPSAELRPNQTDQDSLPPYDVLDAILDLYVRQERSRDEIVEAGFDSEIVQKVIRLVDRNEYKRRQAAPGLKVTSRAFGVGRRMPIAQRYEANNHDHGE
ncbi:MAG TPA: NAD+ synthase [Phycisphaerae bacterium]|nr:NAD+ synthase [Phycisphaerae bacterium]